MSDDTHPSTRAPLKDRLVDPAPNPEQRLLASERVAKLREALAQLAPTDQAILAKHYGLGDQDPWTAAELARSMHLTTRQMEYRLKVLRAKLEEALQCVK